jgi:GNAT superfamily N-acetyltransferase
MNQLRTIDLLDRPDLLQIVAQWVHDEWSSFSGRSQLQTVQRFADVEGGRIPVTLVALVGDEPAGVASLRERDSVDLLPGAGPWICNVYVTVAMRGRGVAASLCVALEYVAQAMGYSVIYLSTPFGRNSLYHRLGYQEVAVVRLGSHEFHVLRKALAADRTGDDRYPR